MRLKLRYLTLTVILIAIGYLLGKELAGENWLKEYSCHDIRNFHADYLIKNYNVDFNTSEDHPNRATNQKASDLNALLFKTCTTDPTL